MSRLLSKSQKFNPNKTSQKKKSYFLQLISNYLKTNPSQSLSLIQDKLLNNRLLNHAEIELIRDRFNELIRSKVWNHVTNMIPIKWEPQILPKRSQGWDKYARKIFTYYQTEIEWNKDNTAEINLSQISKELGISRKTIQRKTNRFFEPSGLLQIISQRNGRGHGLLVRNLWRERGQNEKRKYLYAKSMERKELFDAFLLSQDVKSWTASETLINPKK